MRALMMVMITMTVITYNNRYSNDGIGVNDGNDDHDYDVDEENGGGCNQSIMGTVKLFPWLFFFFKFGLSLLFQKLTNKI